MTNVFWLEVFRNRIASISYFPAVNVHSQKTDATFYAHWMWSTVVTKKKTNISSAC